MAKKNGRKMVDPRDRKAELGELQEGSDRLRQGRLDYDPQRFRERYEDRSERSRNGEATREDSDWDRDRDEEYPSSPHRRHRGEDYGSEREFRGAFRRGAREEQEEPSSDIEEYTPESGKRAASAKAKKAKPARKRSGSGAKPRAKRS